MSPGFVVETIDVVGVQWELPGAMATLKDTLGLRLLRPLAAEDLMEKVEIGLVHYAYFRPHQGIGGATPAEIYFRRTPAHLSAIPPPRSRVGEGPMDLPFLIDYLDAERLLPVLVRKAA